MTRQDQQGERVTEWRSVVGFPDYQVSDEGDLRGPDGSEVEQEVQLSGLYPSVTFPGHGPGRTHLVYRLVTAAFLGPRPDGMVTRHLDGNGMNSGLSNLVYGTQSENMLDRVRHGTDPMANRTHCKNGHEFTAENIYRNPSHPRARVCRACLGVAPKPSGEVRPYGVGSITQRTSNGLWIGRYELGKDENGKRQQYTVTSMDRDVVEAKIAAKHAEMTA